MNRRWKLRRGDSADKLEDLVLHCAGLSLFFLLDEVSFRSIRPVESMKSASFLRGTGKQKKGRIQEKE